MYEEYFAKQLRAYRESRGLTLQELADILHTSKQVLSRYETGQRVPKISVANEYATILGLPLSYFMPNPPRWHDSVWEDWQRARSNKERYAIIEAHGLDPRAYEGYLAMKAEEAQPVPPFRVDEHEKKLVIAYREQPEAVRQSIDRILQINPAEPVQLKYAARGQLVPPDGPIDPSELDQALSELPPDAE